MSSVVIAGDTSGSITLAAPAVAGSNTITLPANTGTVLTSASSLTAFPSGFANGITEADQWYLTSNVIVGAIPFVLTSNFGRVTTGGFSLLGTGMTQSSGVFSFPSTGRWLIGLNLGFYDNAAAYARCSPCIQTTVNNSTYVDVLIAHGACPPSYSVESCACQFVFNVTDTSQCKVRFAITGKDGTVGLYGGNNSMTTVFTFIKLAN